MINQQIAAIFRQIAAFLEMENVPFKPIAYRRAAWGIEALERDVEDMYKEGGLEALEEVPGVGKDLALKIEEYIKTGKVKHLDELKKKTPVDVINLTRVEGVGAKTVKKLYEKLGIKTLEELEKAVKTGKIQKLEGFDVKKEQNMLRGLEFLKKEHGRMLISKAWALGEVIKGRLEKQSEIKRVEIVGSLRRMKETIGDIDLLAISANAQKTADFFASLPEVEEVYGKGPAKVNVRLKSGVDADLRVCKQEEFGAAMQYFTGSKEHNIETRTIAVKKGWKLNEYGLFAKNSKSQITLTSEASVLRRQSHKQIPNSKFKIPNGWVRIAGKTEEEIYEKLGMQTPPPEMRENQGEVEAALEGKLPKLIEYDALKGDLQVQTNWSDGEHSIREMVEAAVEAGLHYIGITDHTKAIAVAGGLDEKIIEKQFKEIDQLQKEFKGKFEILKSAEIDILKDGSLDLSDEMLVRLDYTLVTLHTHGKMSEKEITERVIKAMKNPYVDILGHPTGRLILRRQAYEVNVEEIIKAAKEYGVAIEVNAYPERLDLKDVYIRKAVEAGVKLVINSDAHNKAHFKFLRFGIAQARRGWATSEDILNTLPVEQFLKKLRRNRK
ncbi:MAG: PHP domain-containing protein [Candidatus Portnoybacteria bacterium]|nr:PHP domain-containing protein [Candidatus Portnoybacteria bacterium]